MNVTRSLFLLYYVLVQLEKCINSNTLDKPLPYDSLKARVYTLKSTLPKGTLPLLQRSKTYKK